MKCDSQSESIGKTIRRKGEALERTIRQSEDIMRLAAKIQRRILQKLPTIKSTNDEEK